MPKPILLSVDDDSDVLRAIERDLRSQYGAEYRVIGSDSPEGALDLLKQLKVRNDSVALLLADQRMPRMDGVEFLQQAMEFFPPRSAHCSLRMPIPMPQSAPSIMPASTTFS
jgi:thioredoxin reductase (NADPH)